MNTLVAQLEEELRKNAFIEVQDLIMPKFPGRSPEDKLRKLKSNLKRALSTKDDTSALINAYYMGKIINEEEDISARFKLRKTLTRHYETMALNIYDLFEPNPNLILHVYLFKPQDLRAMTRGNILLLRRTIEKNTLLADLAGAQRLEEEIVNSGSDAAEL